jgi:hypothetical protein
MTKNQPPSDATRQEVFSVHLRYETLRLIEQYALLLNPNKYCSGLEPEVAKAVHDGLLVAFCSHARNLLEFFFVSRTRTIILRLRQTMPNRVATRSLI